MSLPKPIQLLQAAADTARSAYAPYSAYPVGAAISTVDGALITGCNVENVSYGLTLCAERTAVVSAIAAGHRSFRAVGIVAAGDAMPYPCGACRQVLAEFCGPDCMIYVARADNLEAYLKAMKAHFLYLNGSKDGLLKALDLAQEAIDLDPNYAFAYKVLGGANGITLWRGLSKNPKETLKRTIELHQRSVELDDSLAIAHVGLGYWIMYTQQHDMAVAEGERAFILEPGSADVLHLYATILAYAGRREEAIPLFEEALRLNPKPPNSYLRHYSMALRDTGGYRVDGKSNQERTR